MEQAIINLIIIYISYKMSILIKLRVKRAKNKSN